MSRWTRAWATIGPPDHFIQTRSPTPSLSQGTGGREAWVCVKIPTSGRSRVPAT